MAKVTYVTDDLDGSSDDVDTVFFLYNGKWQEIDLSKQNRDKFDRVMKQYVEKGRESTRIRVLANVAKTESSTAKNDAAAIRQWAKENGHEVGDKGKLPQDIIDLYNKAQENK